MTQMRTIDTSAPLALVFTDDALWAAEEMLKERKCGPAHWQLTSAARNLGAAIERSKGISVVFKEAQRSAKQKIAVRARKLRKLSEQFVRMVQKGRCG